MPTRRKFLLNCSTVALTASMTPASIFARPAHFKEVPQDQVSFANFSKNLNSVFQVETDAGTIVRLQLVEVKPLPVPPALPLARPAEDANNEKFSLLFRGLLKQPLEQGSHWFEQPSIGRFPVFIVPIGSMKTTAIFYEAIFNRPPKGPLPRAGVGGIPVGSARNKRTVSRETSRGL
jgi:hypothetical protein